MPSFSRVVEPISRRQGRRLDQPLVEELARKERILIISGHYEGIDERVVERLQPLEISVGDYVLKARGSWRR